jgi:hypothetical protein
MGILQGTVKGKIGLERALTVARKGTGLKNAKTRSIV